MDAFRRVGAHEVTIEGKVLHQGIVEIMDGRVVNFFEFEDELPMTEWLGGTIVLRREKGTLHAYWNETLID